MVFRLLHTADLHLDRTFGYLPLEVARKRRRALRRCLERLLDVARAERVDAVTIGGDLYEQATAVPDLEHVLPASFAALAPMRVLISPGNHDPLVPGSLYRRVEWGENVHVFTTDGWTSVPVAPGLTIWGSAFLGPERRDNPFARARPPGDGLHLALLHGAAGAAPGSPYGAFAAGDPRAAGFALTLLGHIHQGYAERPGPQPAWIYPGSPEPLDFGETGPRSALLITVDPEVGAIAVERHTLDSARYFAAGLPLDGAATLDDVVTAARRLGAEHPEWTGQYVRLLLRGRCQLPEGDLAHELALAFGASFVLVEDGTAPTWDLEALASEPTIRGAFVRRLQQRMASAAPAERALCERALAFGLEALEGRTPAVCDCSA